MLQTGEGTETGRGMETAGMTSGTGMVMIAVKGPSQGEGTSMAVTAVMVSRVAAETLMGAMATRVAAGPLGTRCLHKPSLTRAPHQIFQDFSYLATALDCSCRGTPRPTGQQPLIASVSAALPLCTHG